MGAIYQGNATPVGNATGTFGSGVSLTSNVPANIASVQLPSGRWRVYGFISLTGSAGNMTNTAGGYNTVSGTLGPLGQSFQATVPGGLSTYIVPLPETQFIVTTATTYFLVGFAGFSAGTVTAAGTIFAVYQGPL